MPCPHSMYCRSQTEGACYLCAGLANGKLAIYDQYMLQVSDTMHSILLTPRLHCPVVFFVFFCTV